MSDSEFDLIRRYFVRPPKRADVALGIGDDAALLSIPADCQLVVAVDTLAEGVHFPEQTAPADIAWKALAVNLSDLAAMGAEPAWFTLSLTLPAADEAWLREFSRGLFALADCFNIDLVGGDTTRGPLSITIQAHGLLSKQALQRDAAKAGQLVMVSGTLGDAALALQYLQANKVANEFLLEQLNRPQPRLALGLALSGVASAAIDISDGLLADLGHVLTASHCGARLELEKIPRSQAFDASEVDTPWPLLLCGGDDYELCFTIDAHQLAQVNNIAQQTGVPVTHIGYIESEPGLRCLQADGGLYQTPGQGYDHFR